MSSVLRAENLTKSYPQGEGRLQILKGVSLEVQPTETVSIMGRSGCGKSTLISLLSALDTPDGGRIEILNQDLGKLRGGALNSFRARNIGIIFQQFHILDHLTALENVRLPLDLNSIKEADDQAERFLAKVGLDHRAGHYPSELSRGECQRVAIARVLVMKPKLLLADEPTGSLDTVTGKTVMDLIFELVRADNIALVMATHDLAVAERCARQLHMSDGLI